VRLVLDVRGDSVFGTYSVQSLDDAGPAPVAREFRGTVSGNKVVFSMSSRGRINMGGNEQEVTLTSTYDATVDGDQITGTIETTAPELPMQPRPRPFSGTRVAG
jgi:hypothetical protein